MPVLLKDSGNEGQRLCVDGAHHTSVSSWAGGHCQRSRLPTFSVFAMDPLNVHAPSTFRAPRVAGYFLRHRIKAQNTEGSVSCSWPHCTRKRGSFQSSCLHPWTCSSALTPEPVGTVIILLTLQDVVLKPQSQVANLVAGWNKDPPGNLNSYSTQSKGVLTVKGAELEDEEERVFVVFNLCLNKLPVAHSV